jgi:phage-related minor tail protein|nr:MAG TPA: minor tail protein [Caudoviricetes sp.]
MAGYDIGPKISIKGESEFNQSISKINQNLKEYGSELKAVSSEFDAQADSMESLTAKNKVLKKQYDEQSDKMKLLSDQIKKQTDYLDAQAKEIQQLTNEYGENSSQVQKAEKAYANTESTISKLKTAFNETTAYANKLSSEISDNDTKLDGLKTSADGAASSVKDYSKATKEAGDVSNDTKTDVEQLQTSFEKLEVAQIASDFASDMIENIKGAVEESKEYLKIMGSLEVSSSHLNYTTNETKQTYKQLIGVLGDTQSAATTTANLQAIGLEQSQLTQITKGAIGAWARYGDSIPIDGLAESINETIKTGTVTGNFADMLNWAGTSEDEFNEKLEQCSDNSERAQLVLDEMANQGLMKSADAWNENNKALVESNKAQDEYNEAMADFSKAVMPVFTEFTKALTTIIQIFSELPEPAQQMIAVFIGIIAVLTTIAPLILAVGTACGWSAGGVAALMTAAAPVIAIIVAIIAAIMAIILVIQNWDEVLNFLTETWESVCNKVSELWEGFKKSWTDGFNNVKQKINDFFQNLGENFANGLNNFQNWISNMLSAIVNWAKDFASKGKNAAVNLVKNIANEIKSLPGQFLQWGLDMMSNFASGIWKGFTGWVKGKISGVTNFIKKNLHFSVPDEGPLADADKWMPDFMDLLATGIDRNKSRVESQIKDLQDIMDIGMDPSFTDSTNYRYDPTFVVYNTTTLDGRNIASSMERVIGSRSVSNAYMRGEA